MERLTRKSNTSNMVWFIDREHKNGYAEREPCEMDAHHARLAIAKLAEYEDLEEQGKLLKVPCAVGDTVYVLAECESIPTQLDGTLYGENGEPGTATGYYCPYEDNCPFDDEDFDDCEKYKLKTAVFEDTVLFIACYENEMCVVTEKCAVHSPIGEYVFLAKPEAEAKLAEMEGEK